MSDYTGIYRATVHDINDPENRGRLRALVPAVLGDAPSGWAEPTLDTNANDAQFAVNDRIWVIFEGGDINRPTYISRMGVTSRDLNPGSVTPEALSPDVNLGGGGSDGLVPALSPATTLQPLYSTLLASWPDVVNADLVGYDVYLSAPDRAAAKVSTSYATRVLLGSEADGSPLRHGIVYSVWVHAFDVDGHAASAGAAGSASVAAVTREELQQQVLDDITAAQSTASTAQTAADQAATDAATAQTAADQAAADAVAASNAASTAQTQANTATTNAATAQSAANSAATAASNAQTTANSKGKLIVQVSAPTGSNAVPENLWIDISLLGGVPRNQPKRYNTTTSAWEAVTDKTATDAAAQALTAYNNAATAQARADDAYTQAVNANTAAGNAQTSANGKNTIWYVTPPTSGNKIGDTWFNAAKDNLPNKWDGTAWIEQPLGNQAIGNLDAAKITTGYLDVANRIQAGSMSVGKLDADVIVVNSAYAKEGYIGLLRADQVTTGDLNAVLAVLGGLTVGGLTGKHISINPSVGIELIDVDGVTPLIQFPLSAGAINRFQGDLVAQGFTALGNSQFRGVDNEISVNSIFTLASGVTKPSNYPAITVNYTTLVPNTGSSSSLLVGDRGLHWDGTEYSGVYYTGNAIQRYNPATNTFTTVSITWMSDGRAGQANVTGFTKIGVNYYVSYDRLTTLGVYERWLGKINATGTEIASMKYETYSYTAGATGNIPSLDNDGTNLLVGQINPTDGKVRVQTFSANLTGGPTATWISSTALVAAGNTTQLATLLYGSFDFGATRYVVRAKGSATIYSYNTSGAEQASERWDHPAEGGSAYDAIWDGTRFHVMSYAGIQKMSTDKTSDTITSAFTWYDSDPGGTGTHETQVGPVSTATRKPRYGVQFNVGVLPADAGDPDSPDSVRIYAKQGAYSTTADLKLQVSESGNQGRLAISPDSLDAGAAPPTSNSFLDGVAAQLKSAIGGFIIKGDGTGDWPYLRTTYLDPVSNRVTTLEGQTLNTRLNTLEGQTLNTRLNTLEGQTLNTRLTTLENANNDNWHTVGGSGDPAFQNGWTAQSEPVQFRKDRNGNVIIRGRAARGTAASGSTIFTLPVGYRPTNTVDGVAVFGQGNIIAVGAVQTDGVVRVNWGTAATWYGLPQFFSAVA